MELIEYVLDGLKEVLYSCTSRRDNIRVILGLYWKLPYYIGLYRGNTGGFASGMGIGEDRELYKHRYCCHERSVWSGDYCESNSGVTERILSLIPHDVLVGLSLCLCFDRHCQDCNTVQGPKPYIELKEASQKTLCAQ